MRSEWELINLRKKKNLYYCKSLNNTVKINEHSYVTLKKTWWNIYSANLEQGKIYCNCDLRFTLSIVVDCRDPQRLIVGRCFLLSWYFWVERKGEGGRDGRKKERVYVWWSYWWPNLPVHQNQLSPPPSSLPPLNMDQLLI